MLRATLNSKGQITLPKDVRRALGVGAGDRIAFIETSKGVFEVMVASTAVRELKGLIDAPRRRVSVEDMREAARPVEIYSARRIRGFDASETEPQKALRRTKPAR